MTRTTASRRLSRRHVGVMAVAALALAGVAPGVAEAAGELPGGLTPETAVAVGLDTSFPGSNQAATSVSAYPNLPYWSSTVWYSFTTSVPGVVTAQTYDRTYDTTLEIWTSARTFVAENDDYVGLASRVQAGVSPGDYLLGLGGFAGAKGTATVSLTFTPMVPTAPTALQVTPATRWRPSPGRRRPSRGT